MMELIFVHRINVLIHFYLKNLFKNIKFIKIIVLSIFFIFPHAAIALGSETAYYNTYRLCIADAWAAYAISSQMRDRGHDVTLKDMEYYEDIGRYWIGMIVIDKEKLEELSDVAWRKVNLLNESAGGDLSSVQRIIAGQVAECRDRLGGPDR